MKRQILVIALVTIVGMASCSRYYTYDVTMTHPKTNRGLNYSNDTLDISFSLQPKYIGLEIYNKTNDGMKYNWDDISIALNGSAFKALHKMATLDNLNQVQAPTTIPPKSKLSDYLFPREKVYFMKSILNGSSYTKVSDIFPTQDYGNSSKAKYIKALKGTRITIFMPYYLNNNYISQYYDFIINDVVASKKAPKKK